MIISTVFPQSSTLTLVHGITNDNVFSFKFQKLVSPFQWRQRQRGWMRRDGCTYVSLGSARLYPRERLYLRANKMLLLQLRQHSSLRDSGVRGEIILVTKIHERKKRKRERGEKKKEKDGEKGISRMPLALARTRSKRFSDDKICKCVAIIKCVYWSCYWSIRIL